VAGCNSDNWVGSFEEHKCRLKRSNLPMDIDIYLRNKGYDRKEKNWIDREIPEVNVLSTLLLLDSYLRTKVEDVSF